MTKRYELLREYLKDCTMLETDLFKCTLTIDTLQRSKKNYPAKKTAPTPVWEQKKSHHDWDDAWYSTGVVLLSLLAAIAVLVWIFMDIWKGGMFFLYALVLTVFPGGLFGAFGFFVARLVFALILSAIHSSSDNAADNNVDQINASRQAEQARTQAKLDAEHAAACQEIRAYNGFIDVQCNAIKKAMEKPRAKLDQLYRLGIVHRKYREQELVAISYLYDCLDTGREYELVKHIHGPGAYQLYEEDARDQKIITELKEINKHLQDIKDNQYSLYVAIQEGNAIARSIESNTSRIASDTAYVKDYIRVAQMDAEKRAAAATSMYSKHIQQNHALAKQLQQIEQNTNSVAQIQRYQFLQQNPGAGEWFK